MCRVNVRLGELRKNGEYVILRGQCDVNRVDLFYSIVNRKYIRGNIGSNDIIYKLRPGRYIEVIYYRNWFIDPPKEVSAALIEISDDMYLEAVSCITYYNSKFVLESQEVPPQIKDLVQVKDVMHGSVVNLFNKVYSEDENEKLLKFVLNKKEIVEYTGETG
jgi:hypothetical protein